MHRSLIDLLACPRYHDPRPMEASVETENADEIVSEIRNFSDTTRARRLNQLS